MEEVNEKSNDIRKKKEINGLPEDLLSRGTKDSTDEMLREIALKRVRERLENFQSTIIDEVKNKMDTMVDDVLQEIKRYERHSNELKALFQEQNEHVWSNRKKTGGNEKTGKLPEKIFVPRNSLLTDLFEVKHIKSIYHIFISMLLILFLNTVIHDFVVHGRINVGLDTITTGFGKFHIALAIWSVMQLVVFGLYFAFKIWAKLHFMLRKSETLQHFIDTVCLVIFVFFQLLFGYAASIVIFKYDLALISSLSVLMEMIRFVMKMHAFVRSNVPKQLTPKQKTSDKNDKQARFPSFSKYLYFLFAPTLIYRDEYPRTLQIRWNFVMARLFEICGIIFEISFIHERFLRPSFQKYGEQPMSSGTLIVAIFSFMMPAMIIYLSCFFCLLHSWLNATSEMLKFSDRMFYKDWWTSSNYDTYYRTWNVVIHDWLYEYIYKDSYEHIFKRSKLAAALTVFMISAFVHEYILMIAFRFFYPVMFVFFGGLGVIMTFATRGVSKTSGNLLLWWSIALGNGVMFSLYSLEYYARKNCLVDNDLWITFATPISWSCPGIIENPDWKLHIY